MVNEVKKYVKKIRSEFSKMALNRSELSENPFIQFENWFQDAMNAELIHPQSIHYLKMVFLKSRLGLFVKSLLIMSLLMQ